MAAMRTVGLESQGRSTSTMWGQKTNLSECIHELRASMALQGQARKFYTTSQEEKLQQNQELLPHLREAVREDVHILGLVWKHELTISEACGVEQPLGITLASKTLEVAQEKLRAEIYDQMNTCNMLLYQVRQRSRAQEQLQRRLQQLQMDAQMDAKQHQAPGSVHGVTPCPQPSLPQVVRTLENNIEKMQTKVHTGQKVAALYLVVRDALRKELAHLPLHLDLLSEVAELRHGEVEDMELMALDGLRAAHVTKEHMVRMETQFLAERELRHHTLAAQKVPVDRRWLKEASERLLKAQARHDLAGDFLSLPAQDPLVAAKLEATKSRLEHEDWVMEKMEKAKAAVQCSCLWDIHSRLLAQQKSLVELEQYLTECKEKKQELKKTLKELEMKLDELKFHQPPNTTRCRELAEELGTRLQWEEARLEQRRAQLLRSQEVLLEFENGLDNLFIRLHGITVPGQEDSVKAMGVDEKLQQCEQKLQYLVQRVADLPPHSHTMNTASLSQAFVKIRQLLEKTIANDLQNQKVSLEDVGMRVQDDFDFTDKHCVLVLTREDIKKQGLQLMESKKKSKKK
ncbi:coiled-coil domain-containing protein 183-like [Strigops habroptila]|uniref:coiled-coil domain-containing protein 183-like n=1 Tax=Strigops habroptila TaxID=2489341 RepID=UPI0011CEFFDF|nr:coiled-coil domain-containing protein 183-like [Strigops habroptila]